MAVHRQRRLSLLIALVAGVAAAGCAARRGAGLGAERPRSVALVVRSLAEAPPAQRALDELVGPDGPEAVLARDVGRLLRARGWATVAAPGPTDAVLELVLSRMDVSALRVLGQVEIDLEATLRGPDGAVLWQASRAGPTPVQTYRARNDWAPHLRTAARQLLGGMP
ncbi:MAG TPA: hypothetical protein VN033_01050 [Vulgatibacter sp.]|nr:hypothetical protein [Vulgatibacter sp.]